MSSVDTLAYLCFGDFSLRRGECKIDMRGGYYLLSLPSDSLSVQNGSVNHRSRGPVYAGHSGVSRVASRDRRAC